MKDLQSIIGFTQYYLNVDHDIGTKMEFVEKLDWKVEVYI